MPLAGLRGQSIHRYATGTQIHNQTAALNDKLILVNDNWCPLPIWSPLSLPVLPAHSQLTWIAHYRQCMADWEGRKLCDLGTVTLRSMWLVVAFAYWPQCWQGQDAGWCAASDWTWKRAFLNRVPNHWWTGQATNVVDHVTQSHIQWIVWSDVMLISNCRHANSLPIVCCPRGEFFRHFEDKSGNIETNLNWLQDNLRAGMMRLS